MIKSAEIKNEITSYIEKVDYMLSDVKRYEETYYRSAREILNEILTRTLWPSSYFTMKLEESKNSTYDYTGDDEYSDLPDYIEKVPFRSNKEELFQNRKVYSAYYNLLMDHRNGSRIYRQISDYTDALLSKLESVSEN